MKEEIFKPLIVWKQNVLYDYSKEYVVSNFGYIKSLYTGKIIKSFKQNSGYLKVNLYKNGIPHNFTVHRIVCSSFPEICGEWFESAECNHKDENTLNNEALNLEWVKPISNKRYGTRINRVAEKTKNGKQSLIVLQNDLNNNLIQEWVSVREIERVLGYSHCNISKCCNGKQNSAYGYIWKYKKAV